MSGLSALKEGLFLFGVVFWFDSPSTLSLPLRISAVDLF